MRITTLLLILSFFAISCGKKAKDGDSSAHLPTRLPQETAESTETQQLVRAVEANDVRTAQTALDHGANPNALTSDKDTVLIHAVKEELADMVNALVLAGANLEAVGLDKLPPVIIAGMLPSPDMVRLLIQAGAKIDSADSAGNNVLALTIEQKNTDLAEWLVNQGIPLDHPDSHGRLAAARARELGLLHLADLIQLRLDYANNHDILSAYKSMLKIGDLRGVQAILQEESAQLQSFSAPSALSMAVRLTPPAVDLAIVNMLLDAQFSPLGADQGDDIPVIVAASQGRTEVVKVLAKLPNVIFQKDAKGYSALVRAVDANMAETVQALVDLGADHNYKTIVNGKKLKITSCDHARAIVASDKEAKKRRESILTSLRCGYRWFLTW